MKDDYWYINDFGRVDYFIENEDTMDNFRYKTRNYFKTEEEAQAHLDNINTYYDLMDLAEELNGNEEIDKDLGQIYCLNKNFKNIALERIGEERLIKLFKGE